MLHEVRDLSSEYFDQPIKGETHQSSETKTHKTHIATVDLILKPLLSTLERLGKA
jgi:hypothetical protein